MKIELNKDSFVQVVNDLSRVATNRSSIQAISGIKFESKEQDLVLSATDLELGISYTFEGVNVVESGDMEFVLPARLLAEIGRSLSDSTATIADQEGGLVTLTSGGAKFNLKTIDASDFPQLPKIDEKSSITLESDLFTETASWVARSASHDDTRPILTGVQVIVDGSKLRMVATDSYRLSVKETVLSKAAESAFDLNVPAKALQELGRLGSHRNILTISKREGQVVFNNGAYTVTSRLLDGQFPNYKQLVPEQFDYDLKLNGDELRSVVRRIGLMAQKNVALKLSFTQGSLTVSAQSPDVGEASESIPAPFSGEAFEIGFNPEFLRDSLEGAHGDEISFKLINPLRPAMVQPFGDDSYLCLIMPVRLEARVGV